MLDVHLFPIQPSTISFMIKPEKDLFPDWDEDNINHIAEHGLRPEQVEEVYYSEGPFPTLAIRNRSLGGV